MSLISNHENRILHCFRGLYLPVLLVLSFHFLSVFCYHGIRKEKIPFKIVLKISENVPVKAQEITGRFPAGFNNDHGPNIAEVVILNYSSGKEIFTYSEKSNDNIDVTVTDGMIEAMVKIKNARLIKGIYFIKSSGKSKNEIIGNFIIKLKDLLDGQ